MCGDRELDFSDYSSSDDDTESVDSFHSASEEKSARRWAYAILFCYTFAAVSFMGMFLVWFFTKKNDDKKGAKEQ